MMSTSAKIELSPATMQSAAPTSIAQGRAARREEAQRFGIDRPDSLASTASNDLLALCRTKHRGPQPWLHATGTHSSRNQKSGRRIRGPARCRELTLQAFVEGNEKRSRVRHVDGATGTVEGSPQGVPDPGPGPSLVVGAASCIECSIEAGRVAPPAPPSAISPADPSIGTARSGRGKKSAVATTVGAEDRRHPPNCASDR